MVIAGESTLLSRYDASVTPVSWLHAMLSLPSGHLARSPSDSSMSACMKRLARTLLAPASSSTLPFITVGEV